MSAVIIRYLLTVRSGREHSKQEKVSLYGWCSVLLVGIESFHLLGTYQQQLSSFSFGRIQTSTSGDHLSQ